MLLLLLSACLMRVDSDEVAVVYRFGAVERTADAGLSVRLPAPFEADERVQVTELRRAEPGRLRLVTGDTNLIELDLAVQYTISDPVAWSVALEDPEQALVDLVASVAGALVAGMEVDELLTTGRADLQRRIAETTQSGLDRLGVGLHIEGVEVRELAPPEAVVAAFNDVSSARGDQETTTLAADAYASQRLPQVRGEAVQQVEAAKTSAAQLSSQAESEAARFERLQEPWRSDRAATQGLLRAQAAERVGERVTVKVLPEGSVLVLPEETP